MDSQLVKLLIIEIINAMVAIACFIYNMARKKKGAVTTFVVMLLCPVIGPLFYLFEIIFRKAFFSEPVDLAGVIFGKDKVKGVFHAQVDRESNLIPMEEAIAVTNSKDLRSLMMNVVQGDIKNTLQSISLALNSEDSETSHYAASVLQDELNEFRINVENFRKTINEKSTDSDEYAGGIIKAVEYMNPFLEQKVFTDIEQINFVHVMAEFCEKLYAKGPEFLSGSIYEAVSMRLLEIEEFDECEKWCERGQEQCPNLLSSYTCRLKLYFNSHNREKFFATVVDLKNSSVVLDRETLELIRVFC